MLAKHKDKKHPSAEAMRERQVRNLTRARTRTSVRLPQFGVIWQLDVNREDYLVKYGWLRIEGDGAKWYCWACHDYGGANLKSKLGTTKAHLGRRSSRSTRRTLRTLKP